MPDPCATWLQVRHRPITNDRLSARSLSWMRSVIDESLEASPPVEGNFLPTRLLDLGSKDSPSLRLIDTKGHDNTTGADPSRRRYAALSYCWGSAEEAKRQLITTQDTIETRMSGIERSKLPRTVSDAVEVCRHLDIRYLWVDALCIIQEDKDDWTHESFEMARVYSNSFLTLCILRGNSCSSGFLEPSHTPPTMRINFQSQLDSSISGSLYLRMQCPPSYSLDKSYGEALSFTELREAAWRHRGWTLQEEQLSPRKLYFGDFMMYYKSERLEKVADNSWFLSGEVGLLPANRAGTLDDNMVCWYRLMSRYTGRKLSYEHDKFPAVSALARSINDRFPDLKYVAGLWELDLQSGLLWTRAQAVRFEEQYEPRGSSTYVAPSWSWACCSHAVNWDFVTTCALDRSTVVREFVLRDADVLSKQLNPHGEVLKARLAISGKLFKPPGGGRPTITLSETWGKDLAGVGRLYSLWSEEGELIAELTPDWDRPPGRFQEDENDPGGPIDQLLLLLISNASYDWGMRLQYHSMADPRLMLGLLVRPCPGTADGYEKLGLWYSLAGGPGGKKLWDNIEMQDIVLI